MSKHLVRFSLLISLVFSSAAVCAQNYVPFPTDSARWRVSYSLSLVGCTGFAGEAQYEITGDTVFGNQTYHKIYMISYSAGPACTATGGNGFAGAIREDSSKHVFIRSSAANPEELLYDFNMQVGDTVMTLIDCCHDAVVDSIDSILIGATYRKQYHVSTGWWCGMHNQTIIEGIGSMGGPFACLGYYEETSYLTCFWQNGNAVLGSSQGCTPLVEGIQENQPTFSFEVYPNPATDFLNITYAVPQEEGSCQLTITSVDGREVLCRELPADQTSVQIDISFLAAGEYVWNVVGDGKLWSSDQFTVVK